jgi:hypothetical protein
MQTWLLLLLLPLVAGQQGVTIIPDVDINYFFPELTEDSTVHKKQRQQCQ